jgi:hypothetical protein
MPILPPIVTAPYDTFSTVLDYTRVRLNDAIQSLGGDVLTNDAPFTQTYCNMAFRWFQQYLANLGYIRVTQEVVLTGLPRVTTTSQDPAIQVWLNWSQYFDGANYFVPPDTPVLPQDFIRPLRVWERWTGFNQIFSPMDQILDGLPTLPKVQANRMWEWRGEALYMPGSTTVEDLRLRYAAFLPDITDAGTPWYDQPIPIMRCVEPLANYVAYLVAQARGDAQAANFKTEAEAGANQVFNRDVQAKQRVNVRRRPRSGRTTGY